LENQRFNDRMVFKMLNILLTADNNYGMQLGVCIVSIMENNENLFDKINIHILNNGIFDSDVNKINSLKKIIKI